MPKKEQIQIQVKELEDDLHQFESENQFTQARDVLKQILSSIQEFSDCSLIRYWENYEGIRF